MIRTKYSWIHGRVNLCLYTGIHTSCPKNPVGVYLLDEQMRKRVFGPGKSNGTNTNNEFKVQLALEHLKAHGLANQKTTEYNPIKLDLPPLLGDDLDEHFQKIGHEMCQPYLQWCQEFINSPLPEKPLESEWVLKSGWTRYAPGKPPEPVEYPNDPVIVFDTEVLYKVHDFTVLATAVSSQAWYSWISPWVLSETNNYRHLLSLGPHTQAVIGHNVGYDRRAVREEYDLEQSKKFFIDTMSLHIATHGMCSRQRPTFRKLHNAATGKTTTDLALKQLAKEEPWFGKASTNGLNEVTQFLLNEGHDKSDRDYFGQLTREELAEPSMLRTLINYCAKDSFYTKRIFNLLLPKFRELCPHPVSFGALRFQSSAVLPISDQWTKYIQNSESMFENVTNDVIERLHKLAQDAVEAINDPETLKRVSEQDPWLKQLDWTIKPIRYTKAKKRDEPPRLAKNQKLPGKPQWFKDLYPSGETKPMNLTIRTRATTLLLRLQWDGHPLVWYDKYGWTFWAPKSTKSKYLESSYMHIEDSDDGSKSLFKLPHPDGDQGRCTNPLAKSFIPYFEKGILTSENETAKKAIEANSMCSYWISSRSRITKQIAVYQEDYDMGLPANWGFILPRIVPMGTVTRRAVEDTWLTASNAKKNRIGSELKAMVRAPPGYTIVGADVDSEELWIASVVGDSLFGIHGGTALGWMTLEGSKSAGTDLHSNTASILGISRNEAKVFNYGRIYGAGQTFAVRLLRQFNPKLTVAEATKAATALYESTKGVKTNSRVFPLKRYWRGGSESIVFNQLELLAKQPRQRTPILGAGITEALAVDNLRGSNFLTSRINWSIQSSGVDYLHLLIAGMNYLCKVYGISARLLITVHDEVRFLVKDVDSRRAALALQISNLWTRAMFCQQLGLDNMPCGIAFFSLIDIDKYLRKEVDDPCVTPSNKETLPPGTALSIEALKDECASLGLPLIQEFDRFAQQPSEARVPVMKSIDQGVCSLDYLHAQICSAKEAAQLEQKARSIMNKGELEDSIIIEDEPGWIPHKSSKRSRSAVKGIF